MTEFDRLLDDTDSPGFALLRAARDVPDAPAGALEQTLAGLGVGDLAQAASGAGAATTPWALAGKWLAAGVALGVAGSAGIAAVQDWQSPRASVPAVASAVEPGPSASVAAAPQRQEPPRLVSSAALAPSATSARLPKTETPTPEAPKTGLGLAEETQRLDQARRALLGGKPSDALTALNAYDAEFRGGQLAPEAELLRVRALMASGRTAAARELGERLLRGNTDADYAARLREAMTGGTQ